MYGSLAFRVAKRPEQQKSSDAWMYPCVREEDSRCSLSSGEVSQYALLHWKRTMTTHKRKQSDFRSTLVVPLGWSQKCAGDYDQSFPHSTVPSEDSSKMGATACSKVIVARTMTSWHSRISETRLQGYGSRRDASRFCSFAFPNICALEGTAHLYKSHQTNTGSFKASYGMQIPETLKKPCVESGVAWPPGNA